MKIQTISRRYFFCHERHNLLCSITAVTFSCVKISCVWAKVVYNNNDYLMLKVNFMLQTFTKHGKNVPKFYIEDENIGLETF